MKKLLMMTLCILLFKPTYAIYHGDIILPNTKPAFPFVVAIYTLDKIPDKDSEYAACTGSIIDKNWVLTAGHCVVNEEDHAIVNPDQLLVGTGITAGKKPFADKQISVDKIVTFFNPEEGPSTRDIALLHLSKPTTITPVKLPTSPQEIPNLKTNHIPTIVLGYGLFTHSAAVRDEYLRKGDILIQDDQSVDALIKKYKALPGMESIYFINSYKDIQPSPNDSNWTEFNPVTMLGGISPDGKRTNGDDSGGPLLVNKPGDSANNDSYIQIGITAAGLPISPEDEHLFQAEPLFFMNLTNPDTLDFIKKTLAGSNQNNPHSILKTTCDTENDNCIGILLKNFPAGSSMSWEIERHYNLHIETKHEFTWDSPQRNKHRQFLEKIDGEGSYYLPLFANMLYKHTKYLLDKEYTFTSEQINAAHMDSNKIYLSDDEKGLICQVLNDEGQPRSSITKWEDLPQGFPHNAEDIAQAGDTFSAPILEKLLNQGYISLSNESLKNLVVTVTKINNVDVQSCTLSNDLITTPGIVGQFTITRQDDKHYTCEVSR